MPSISGLRFAACTMGRNGMELKFLCPRFQAGRGDGRRMKGSVTCRFASAPTILRLPLQYPRSVTAGRYQQILRADRGRERLSAGMAGPGHVTIQRSRRSLMTRVPITATSRADRSSGE